MEDFEDTTAKARRIAEHLLSLGSAPAAHDEEPASPGAAPATDHQRLLDRVRGLDGVVKLVRAAARAAADQLADGDRDAPDAPRTDRPRDEAATVERERTPGAAPDGDGDRDADRALAFVRKAHRLLLEHPVAAKQAYAALAREGRAFAATPEGAALRERLLRSARLRRASLLWRSLTMGMLDEDDPGDLPSSYLDHLLCAGDRPDLERWLGQLQLERSPR